jgi:anti-sigma factor RsiW
LECDLAKSLIADEQHGPLDPDRRAELEAHLETCAACRHEDAAETALSEALERKLPQYAAPLALKRKLARLHGGHGFAEGVATTSPSKARFPAAQRRAAGYSFLALAIAAAILALYWRGQKLDLIAEARLGDEAVNDHLRVLDGDEPLAIVSSGIHEVKPWFAGKLDFAPALPFAGDEEFPLRGGAVSHFLDRKAATVVYGRRLHTISLFVFRAAGLTWPERDLVPMGHVEARLGTSRGFATILWRDGELGYALVSDVDPKELFRLGVRVAGDARN